MIYPKMKQINWTVKEVDYMNRWFYYIRISSKNQKLDRQKENKELKEFCDRMNINIDEIIIMSDVKSGKNFSRPEYQLLKKVITKGDNIIVPSIDRFGRNYLEGRKEFTGLVSRGIRVYVLNRPMLEQMYNLDDNMSKFMINFLVDWELMSAEEELNRIKVRQREGIEVAKAKNKHLGRPKVTYPVNWGDIYTLWDKGNITAVKAMELLGLKRGTFYKLVKDYKNTIDKE
jgi:DNA invertase Pin-like site-specific DNA recombinase